MPQRERTGRRIHGLRRSHIDAWGARQSRELHRRRRACRAAGLRLHQRQRPRDRAARHRLALSLQRIGRVGGTRGGRVPGPAVHAGVPGRPHRAAAAADLGHGGAAAPAGADRQDAGDHRRSVRRPADRRLRRRLAAEGVRGARRPALRRARARHRRVPRRLQGAVDRGCAELSRQARQLRRHHLRAQAGVQAAPAPLDRRREPAGAEAHGARGRRLVSGLQQSAAPPRHGGAAGAGA